MRKIILFVASISIVLISIAVFFILNNPAREMTSQEKEQALTKIVGRRLNLTGNNVPTGDIQHKGKYASFFYPAAAKIYQPMLNGKPVNYPGNLEYFAFDMEDPTVNVATEAIQATSSITSLSDFPSVRLRQTQSDQYSQTIIKTPDGISGLAFDKSGDNSFEKTAFFYANGKIYTFAITSVDKKTEGDVFSKMLSTLKLY
jgi:hypothetical protein